MPRVSQPDRSIPYDVYSNLGNENAGAPSGKPSLTTWWGQGIVLVKYPQVLRLGQSALGDLAEEGCTIASSESGKPCDACGECSLTLFGKGGGAWGGRGRRHGETFAR